MTNYKIELLLLFLFAHKIGFEYNVHTTITIIP